MKNGCAYMEGLVSTNSVISPFSFSGAYMHSGYGYGYGSEEYFSPFMFLIWMFRHHHHHNQYNMYAPWAYYFPYYSTPGSQSVYPYYPGGAMPQVPAGVNPYPFGMQGFNNMTNVLPSELPPYDPTLVGQPVNGSEFQNPPTRFDTSLDANGQWLPTVPDEDAPVRIPRPEGD